VRRYRAGQLDAEIVRGDAAKMYCRCRKAGITVNSTIDLLIVQTALENNVALLHNDGDFTNIKKAVPELRIF